MAVSDATRALIEAPNVTVDYGAELLDADDNVVSDLSPDLVDGSVAYTADAEVHTTCKVDLLRDLDWPNARVRLWQSLESGSYPVTRMVVDRPGVTVSRVDDSDAGWSAGTLTDVVVSGDVLRLGPS